MKHVLEKNVYKWVKHRFVTMNLSQISLPKGNTLTIQKENLPGAESIKEGDAHGILGYEKTYHYWF